MNKKEDLPEHLKDIEEMRNLFEYAIRYSEEKGKNECILEGIQRYPKG